MAETVIPIFIPLLKHNLRMIDNRFHYIKNTGDSWYISFSSIYSVSFPVYEQRNTCQQNEAFRNPHYHLATLIENEEVASFISYWEFDDYIYIEHLAVNQKLRGKNIGSITLNDFAKTTKKTIILEIDPLIDDISEKRLHFYEKLGYKVNPYKHHHPSYDEQFPPHELLVLSLNKQLSKEQYEQFSEDLAKIVMNSGKYNEQTR